MKDVFCSYYTNSEYITNYMVKKMGIENNDTILEPSAGEGIFIDEILKTKKNFSIDALDINSEAIDILHQKYCDNSFISVRKTDTLLDNELDNYGNIYLWLKETDTLLDEELTNMNLLGGYYNKVIGNPPYGAWQDYDKRNTLKKKYSGHYVKETYSLFLLRCISVLKLGGRLSFIIPDTFLFLNMHSKLREFILINTKINEILIFPSKFFPGVSFGYSNLSIITLERCNRIDALNNVVKIIQGFKSPNEFSQLVSNDENENLNHLQVHKLKQSDILSNSQHRFILASESTNDIINNCKTTLGDVANIVTGFYTGDNLKYIKVLNKDVKGSKNYDEVAKEKIFACNSISGIPNVEEGYIPYIKSSSKYRYSRRIDEWFVQWDKKTIDYYNSNKKSRFQNSSFYFKTGVGIPMVKSKTIKAFLMQDKVFDQSIVGIFPKDITKLYYMLALMNSDVICRLLHTINPTANNSANYVKQLPYIEPTETELSKINILVKNIIKEVSFDNYDIADKFHNEVNNIISKVYNQ